MKIPAATAARANLNHWRAGQGKNIQTKRCVQIFRACEFMAQGLASTRDPLILDGDELAVCVKRAITPERNRLHPGPVEKVGRDEWWEQIDAIAKRWGIKTTREQWERSTKTEAKKEAA
jgi:hypothetical protein